MGGAKRKNRSRTLSQPESETKLKLVQESNNQHLLWLRLLKGEPEVNVLIIRPNFAEELRDGLAWLELGNHQGVIGFDLEWRPDSSKRKSPIALVQLATSNRVLLIHMPNGWEQELKDCLRAWLEDTCIWKVGIGMSQDRMKLKETVDFELPTLRNTSQSNFHSWIDIAKYHVLQEIEYSAPCGFDSFFAIFDDEIKKRSRRIQQRSSNKQQKRRSTLSKWDEEILTPTQIVYAAFDAWGCREILLALSKAAVKHGFCRCLQCRILSSIGGSLRGLNDVSYCERCNFKTFSKADLQDHLRRRCNKPPKSIPIPVPFCRTCHQFFKSFEDLEWHERNEKHGRHRLECQSCGEVFLTTNSKTKTARMKAHVCSMFYTTGFSEGRSCKVSCDECDCIFKDNLGFQLHKFHHAINAVIDVAR